MTNIEQVEENIKLYKNKVSNDLWKYLYEKDLIDKQSSLPF